MVFALWQNSFIFFRKSVFYSCGENILIWLYNFCTLSRTFLSYFYSMEFLFALISFSFMKLSLIVMFISWIYLFENNLFLEAFSSESISSWLLVPSRHNDDWVWLNGDKVPVLTIFIGLLSLSRDFKLWLTVNIGVNFDVIGTVEHEI